MASLLPWVVSDGQEGGGGGAVAHLGALGSIRARLVGARVVLVGTGSIVTFPRHGALAVAAAVHRDAVLVGAQTALGEAGMCVVGVPSLLVWIRKGRRKAAGLHHAAAHVHGKVKVGGHGTTGPSGGHGGGGAVREILGAVVDADAGAVFDAEIVVGLVCDAVGYLGWVCD